MANLQLGKWQKELDDITISSRWGDTRRFQTDMNKIKRRNWLISHIADLKTKKSIRHQRPHRRHSKLGTTFSAGKGENIISSKDLPQNNYGVFYHKEVAEERAKWYSTNIYNTPTKVVRVKKSGRGYFNFLSYGKKIKSKYGYAVIVDN